MKKVLKVLLLSAVLTGLFGGNVFAADVDPGGGIQPRTKEVTTESITDPGGGIQPVIIEDEEVTTNGNADPGGGIQP